MQQDLNSRRTFLHRAALAAGGAALAGPTLAGPAAAAPDPATGQGLLDATQFGALGDGKHDDTAAIQKALNEAGHRGGVVSLPAGNYRVEGNLSVPQNVSLIGSFLAPPRTALEGGTTLLAFAGKSQETGTPFLLLHTNSTVRGLAVFYPEQTTDILPFPATIQGQGDDCSIIDTLLVNPYYGVDFGTHPCGRHWIKSLYLHALHRGVYVAECFDIGRIEDVHIWPFWLNEPKVHDYVSHHAEGFVLGRTDWEYMTNCFTIFYKTGYRFMASASGPGNVILTQCGADEGYRDAPTNAVVVEASQQHAGVSFINSQFMSAQQIDVRPTNTGPVKFTACGFWGKAGAGSVAQLEGTGQVSFNNCHFTGWAQGGDAHTPAIHAVRGGLFVANCDFMDTGKEQIVVGEGVDAVCIMGNRLRGGPKITNSSKGSVAILGNV